METFRYSFFTKLLYRYGNIIATLLLSIHLITSVVYMFEKWYFVFPVLINGGIIYIINKYFIKTYKLFPFNVRANNEKIICGNFFLSKKKYEIKYEDIDKISGGIFSGYPTRPIYFHDARQNITVGFYSHVGNFQKLLTKLLQNIPQDLYNNLTDKLQIQGHNKGKPIRWWAFSY